jgi:hypothetical protein
VFDVVTNADRWRSASSASVNIKSGAGTQSVAARFTPSCAVPEMQEMLAAAPMSSTIPRKVIITRDGKSYRGTYSLEGDVVTVRHTSSNDVIRKMSMPTGGQKAIAVARTIPRELV